jgi:type VI secretion system protein VasG
VKTNLKALIAKLNATTRRAMESAANLALTRTHHEVDVEHVLLALLDMDANDISAILSAYDIERSELQHALRNCMDQFRTGNTRNPVLSERIPVWLEAAWLRASVNFGAVQVRSGHLFIELLVHERLNRTITTCCETLQRIPGEELQRLLPQILSHSREEAGQSAGEVLETARGERPAAAHATRALDKYTINLTALAAVGKIDPVLGRDAEVRQMVDILLRRRQNNPILTGEPGVGKTAVVEGLALRIAQGDVPDALQNVVLRSLDLGLLQAGASVKGEFESRLRSVIDEVKASLVPIILFIDEAHCIIGAGGQAGQNDAANLLKPVLARGELRTIAATTWAEYKKYFEKDAALARRFQVVKIDEPSEEAAIQMVRGVADAMERHHQVRILDEAVVDAVRMSSRYLTGRQLPDKAISVLDTACARVALSRSSTPAAIADLTRMIENIEREMAALQKESDPAHEARLHELQSRRAALQIDIEKRRIAYEEQLRLVLEIDACRSKKSIALSCASETIEDAKSSSAISALIGYGDTSQGALHAARKSLRDLHQGCPLIYDCVDSSSIADVISGWTGIPLGRMLGDEIDTVRNLQRLLEERVIGQSHALEAIARRIQIAKSSLEDPGKPKGVFLLAGPSGVGKTETALALAETLYGGERNLVTINMSEYQEAHSVSGLKGSPPGYVGYGEGGVLTEAVRRRPYSVVLLDEVEKAHPDVLELFFQVFDKGVLEDGEGRLVDFKNTVIILTSNVGTNLIMKAAEHGVTVNGKKRAPKPEDLLELMRPELQAIFKPALLGRLTVIPYYPIKDEAMRAIVALKLEKVRRRLLSNHGASLTYDDALLKAIVARCTEVDSGVRDADSIITNTVLARMSDEVLARMASGQPVRSVAIKVKKEKVIVDVD